MAASASILQEFYKLRDEWEKIDSIKTWRMAIWVAEFQDIDLIDKFIETERLPTGVFDDIFFRFDSIYDGEDQAFEAALWAEYEEWFVPPQVEKYDMYTALKNDGLLLKEYTPDTTLPKTIKHLFSELIRFKACIAGLEHTNFSIYFPPTLPTGPELGSWFSGVLRAGVPKGLRLVTIDYASKRKIKVSGKVPLMDVVELSPKLETLAAIKNEMDKAGSTYDTVSIDAQFRKQVRVVMDNTLKKSLSITDKDVTTLLSLSQQSNALSGEISGLLIAGQAYFSIGENEKSEFHVDQGLKKAEQAMAKDDPAGYPTWKGCIMLKGALLMGKKKYEQAIEVYTKMAKTAATHGDAYYAMEGYRLSGHLLYESKELNLAFETLLLSLVAGSYLDKDIRRQSTFLHAAYLALHVGRKERSPQDIKTLEQELSVWLGDDWPILLEDDGVVNAKVKQKTSFFEFS